VIDFQHNGSPGAFVGLARAFEIPWIMLCDNDNAREGFVRQVQNRGVTDAELRELVRPLPGDGVDLEMFLVRHGFIQEFKQILAERSVTLTRREDESGFEEEIVSKVKADKTGYALALIEKLRGLSADAARVPQFLQTVIEDVITKAS
jgi:putative ATP-dependent endonuclease of OLD family